MTRISAGLALLLGLSSPPQAGDPTTESENPTRQDEGEVVGEPAKIEMRDYVRRSPRCPRKAVYCFGVVVHVVIGEEGPVESPEWLAARIEKANEHFASIDVGFRVIEARKHEPDYWHMATREQRDAIGADRFTRGVVHLFLVGQLDDVDVPGNVIRGVHWRLRRDTKKRWIIMSTLAAPSVLAHELGHFFGLPHSSYAVSIMNKKPRREPPFEQRTFAGPEVKRMLGFRTYMLFFGDLENRRPPPPPGK